ncbi:DUF1428 family protein [Sediminibacillus massiliensis]|uniref:DUF1428 family protein n=1 Tax=Sediminibacillus massiliensis TaxID=1926277 RepID=UPI000A079BBD|nr:DUF1428 family protein [Sediminibacillus massiliensis]
MFTVLQFYRIKRVQTARFLELSDKIAQANMSHGAIEHRIYQPYRLESATKKEQENNIFFLDLKQDEEILFGQMVYRNKSHHDEVLLKMDQDETIQLLLEETAKLVDSSNTYIATFQSADI